MSAHGRPFIRCAIAGNSERQVMLGAREGRVEAQISSRLGWRTFMRRHMLHVHVRSQHYTAV